jgi:hypothetical protein
MTVFLEIPVAQQRNRKSKALEKAAPKWFSR